jgi:hypothetical protein
VTFTLWKLKEKCSIWNSKFLQEVYRIAFSNVTATAGEAIMAHRFTEYKPFKGAIPEK